MNFPYGFIAQVERPTGFDAHGNPLSPDTHEIKHCARDRTSSVETAEGQQVVFTRELIICDDANADVRHEDVVILPDGSRWQVVAEVERLINPFTGWSPGCVITIERANGTSIPQTST